MDSPVSFHLAAASNSPRAACAQGVCAPHFRPLLTPSPTLVISEPLCSMVQSVVYVSLFSPWQLSALLFPLSSATYTSYVRLPQNVVKNSPRVLWDFSLEGKAWLVARGSLVCSPRWFELCLIYGAEISESVLYVAWYV